MHRSVHTPLLPISGAQPFPKWKSRPTGFLHPDVYRISPAEGRPHHSGQARLQSRLQLSSNSTIRPTHSRCSGFISTDRKQVTVARSPSSCMPRQNFTGNSANARCNPLCPAASKICRDFAEISPSESPVGTNTNMSSSGSNAGMNLLPFFTAPKNRSAASLPRSKPFANSPARASGNNFCVAHSAAAAAPGREHSRLISPRCSSAELKYVYGESCLYSRPTAGSRNTTHPHPYGCKPCLCGSITIESALPMLAKLRAAFSARFDANAKYPPYAASTCTRNPNFARSSRISGSGSSDPVAVVPNVATTVPTSPRATRFASAFISMRPCESHSTFSNGNCNTPEILPCV